MTSFKYRFWLKQVRKLKKIKFYLCVFPIGSHRTKGDKVLLLNWYSLHYVLIADRCQSSSDLMFFFVFLIMIIFFKAAAPLITCLDASILIIIVVIYSTVISYPLVIYIFLSLSLYIIFSICLNLVYRRPCLYLTNKVTSGSSSAPFNYAKVQGIWG